MTDHLFDVSTEPTGDSASVQRIALVVKKGLSAGSSANISALMMGQLALLRPEIYGGSVVRDLVGRPHAAIRFSTVVLKAGSGQLLSLADRLTTSADCPAYCCFSAIGQELNNAFQAYTTALTSSDPDLVGVGICGPDQEVRALTRTFSLLQ